MTDTVLSFCLPKTVKIAVFISCNDFFISTNCELGYGFFSWLKLSDDRAFICFVPSAVVPQFFKNVLYGFVRGSVVRIFS